MYVYQYSKNSEVWAVGFYEPNGKWIPESDHNTATEAAARCHYLNGGNQHE